MNAKAKKRAAWGAVVLAVLLLLRYAPTNFIKPGENAFSLTVSDLPETMEVGGELQIEAILHGSPWRSFVVTTGHVPVAIEIYGPDHQGAEIAYDDAAVFAYLPAGGRFTQSRMTVLDGTVHGKETFIPARPGRYTVKIKAWLSIGGKKYYYALPDHTITVE